MSNNARRYQNRKENKVAGTSPHQPKQKWEEDRQERSQSKRVQPKTNKQKLYQHMLESLTLIVADGPAGCVDADTEFLSQHGWKKISEYVPSDMVMQISEKGLNGTLAFPEKYIKAPCSEFYTIKKDRGIDQWLSEDHDVAYTVKRKDKLNKCSILKVIESCKNNSNGFHGKVPCVYNYNGYSLGLSEDEIRFGVALKADGHLTSESTGRYVFRLKKERKIERLKMLLNSIGKDFNVKYEANTGYHIFSLYAKEVSKNLSDWMFCCKEDAEIIMDEFKYWDGDINPAGNRMSRFSTVIKSEADAMQYFGNICGYRATINILDRRGKEHTVNGKQYKRKSIEYAVSFTKQTHITLISKNCKNEVLTEIKKQPSVDGFKYCFTVPTGYLLLRRNNTVFVTGNCGKTLLPCNHAATLMLGKKIDQIVLVRPYASTGNKTMGYNKGELKDKILPFMLPMVGYIKDVLGAATVDIMMQDGRILIQPLETIRGQSFKNAYIIADEMQSAEIAEIQALTTRIGEECTLVICGDKRQNDVKKGLDGVTYIKKILDSYEIRDSGVIEFTMEDCVRSGICKDFLMAYEKDGWK